MTLLWDVNRLCETETKMGCSCDTPRGYHSNNLVAKCHENTFLLILTPCKCHIDTIIFILTPCKCDVNTLIKPGMHQPLASVCMVS